MDKLLSIIHIERYIFFAHAGSLVYAPGFYRGFFIISLPRRQDAKGTEGAFNDWGWLFHHKAKINWFSPCPPRLSALAVTNALLLHKPQNI